MCRILVPLDGSEMAEEILPDACDLAGGDGELLLTHIAHTPISPRGVNGFQARNAKSAGERYLLSKAKSLRERGFKVSVHVEMGTDVSAAIDQVAAESGADLIACATHGRGPGGRLVHGGVIWRAIAQSRIPVLIRHFPERPRRNASVDGKKRLVLVPLDGSPFAEKAIPVAEWLARRLNAGICLVRVVEPLPSTVAISYAVPQPGYEKEVEDAHKYLDQLANRLHQDAPALEVESAAYFGTTHESLEKCVEDKGITHIVMSTHGRTALSRVLLGSVADSLVHELSLPVILIPALAPGRLEEHGSNLSRIGAPFGGSATREKTPAAARL